MLGSRVGVMAYHGGDLEVGTDQIADLVAERTGASLYAVRQPEGMRHHLPSKRFRPEHSERLAAFVHHVDVVITLHGFGRRSMFRSVLLGGGNRGLAGLVAASLRRTLPGYEVIDDLDDIPQELRGVHPHNPVNLPREQGVQIELPPRVRGNGPFWNSWDGGFPTPHTERLVDGLVAAIDAIRAPGAP
ncbi:poly-gamma-glutamate hydrolase family protein [Acidimicrobiia bacterium EGI L10123]|uniref:poly-gamma-glutamate hydrolase family protein n=1 Tax=Salinilacustrithrix flava TaxID=2957203 RepID=UPI003D7C20EE|nr:poly-gamma-glutamate hydrolase family protein [Acidimicrobiia bacterium EGI L10123]